MNRMKMLTENSGFFIFLLFTVSVFVICPPARAQAAVKHGGNNALSCEVENSRLVITEKDGFHFVASNDCVPEFIVGKPRLPVRNFSVALPEGKELAGFEIEKKEKIKLEGNYTIPAVSPPRIISGRQGVKRALSAAGSSGNILRLNSVQRSGSLSVAFFSVPAASYDADRKELYWIKSVSFRIILKSAGIKSLKKSAANRKLLRSLVVNPEMITPADVKTAQTEMYLIITNEGLKNSFQNLADSKSSMFNCEIKTVEEIYSSYEGEDEQAKIRNCITDYYNGSNNLKYVLLGGDTDVVPARGVYARVEGSAALGEVYVDYSIPCDLYYADLTGDWDSSGNGIYGEVADDVNFIPEVFVGRAPVGTVAEAENFVKKVLAYPKTADYKELLLGCELDAVNDGKDLMLQVKAATTGFYEITEMYESSGTLTKAAAVDKINSGVNFVNHAGHAGDSGWYDQFGTHLFIGINDVENLINEKPFVVYSIGCYAGAFDYNDCIGEEFVKNSFGGCTFIGNSRYGFYDDYDATLYSGEFMVDFYDSLFSGGNFEDAGAAFYASKAHFIAQSGTDTAHRWLQFCLNLLGDPFIIPSDFSYVRSTLGGENTAFAIVITTPGVDNELIVTLKNMGASAENLTASIQTADTYVEITSSSSFFGNIPAGGELSNTDYPFRFKVLANCPCEHTINFSLLAKTTDYACYNYFSVSVARAAPALSMIYNYPNPSYGQNVNIVNIPKNSEPVICIYTLSGDEVAVLREGSGLVSAPASMKAEWDLKNAKGFPVASGVYYYFLQSNAGNAKGKIALIR
ncbi:MAG: C25 family cysteine peptidase [bacterium]